MALLGVNKVCMLYELYKQIPLYMSFTQIKRILYVLREIIGEEYSFLTLVMRT